MVLVPRPAALGLPPSRLPGEHVAACTCRDSEVAQLRDLVAGGMGQADASRLLWADNPGADARRIVRAGMAAAFPWLRLPPWVTP